ncbi:S-adenosyl-L-methionine-dependentmethyltransferases superfamily protein [Striga asiatica]|uniref:S-adenosyl-L-methionine-dependentmethyltransferases superfamily protein n=1 Tax=Striga asiatica TaxID=4170 RepID=A0A5A7PD61_STRAF|nr:S-adenosyl-L-methionine-dependentmethyltransferases superfamily protein [Striga asiatica]
MDGLPSVCPIVYPGSYTIWQSLYALVIERGGIGGDFESNDNEIESSPPQGVESSASGKGKRVGKLKRVKDAEVEVVGLVSTLCERADQHQSNGSSRKHATDRGEISAARLDSKRGEGMLPDLSMLLIAARFRRPGWTANEERECYRIFFNICRETPDVNDPTIINSIWHNLSIQLTEEMLLHFSVLKVKAMNKALHTYYREFLTFLDTPGVDVQPDTGLVTVTPTYWAFVSRETDLEYFFRHVGFPWYEECVELWDLRDAATVHIEAGERGHDLIMFDDTDEEIVAADEANGADGADGDSLELENDKGDGTANGLHEVEVDAAVDEHFEEEFVEEPAPVEVVDIDSDEAPNEMDLDTGVVSCVDSE